jgi:hypothetical protein
MKKIAIISTIGFLINLNAGTTNIEPTWFEKFDTAEQTAYLDVNKSCRAYIENAKDLAQAKSRIIECIKED